MIKSLNLKASTLCASGALLVLSGFITVNLAGCGGGGGSALTAPTPSPVGATFNILQQDGSASNGGTITLTRNGSSQTVTADSSGMATIANLSPGTYTVTYTAFDSNGNALPSTTRSITITSTGAQNYTLVQGDTGTGIYNVSGTILMNPTGVNDPDADTSTANCSSTSTPVTANVLISVRDLNSTNGVPIIAQIVRPLQSDTTATNLRGRYTISLPFRPQSFRVEVGPLPNSATPFAGISATTTFTPNTTVITGVDVCTNVNGVIPGPEVTPTPIITNTPFTRVTPTATATPDTTATAAVGATATATAGVGATATATFGVAPTATAAAGVTATSVSATATAGVGPTATASAAAAATAAVSATRTAIGTAPGTGAGPTIPRVSR